MLPCIRLLNSAWFFCILFKRPKHTTSCVIAGYRRFCERWRRVDLTAASVLACSYTNTFCKVHNVSSHDWIGGSDCYRRRLSSIYCLNSKACVLSCDNSAAKPEWQTDTVTLTQPAFNRLQLWWSLTVLHCGPQFWCSHTQWVALTAELWAWSHSASASARNSRHTFQCRLVKLFQF